MISRRILSCILVLPIAMTASPLARASGARITSAPAPIGSSRAQAAFTKHGIQLEMIVGPRPSYIAQAFGFERFQPLTSLFICVNTASAENARALSARAGDLMVGPVFRVANVLLVLDTSLTKSQRAVLLKALARLGKPVSLN